MNHQTSNSDAIRPMLRAIEARIQNARDRRTGEKKPQGMPLFAPPRQPASTIHEQVEARPAAAEGSTPMKAKRNDSSSFSTPMPTRKIWDRQAG